MDWIILAIAVSIVSLIVAGFALFEANRTATASETSAAAATDSLEIAKLALKTGQRPWVCLTNITPNVGIHLIPQYVLQFSLSNLGPTPAFDLTVEWYITTLAESCPAELQRAPQTQLPSNLVLGPNQTIQPSGRAELSLEQIDAIGNGQIYLVTYGIVAYKDAFQDSHETRWCAFWRAGNFTATPLHNSVT
jgi:hypothetical protein